MANETKHTPGPWVIDRNPDQRVGTHIRASVPTYKGAVQGVSVARITIGGGVAEDHRGNAALIAAAPEMLEALHRADLHIRLLVNKGEYLMGTDAILDAIRAAIAKAEGR